MLFRSLKNDLSERVDLSANDEYSKVLAELSARMKAWFQAQGDPIAKAE